MIIELKNISKKYKNSSSYALENINLKLDDKGKILVSGKSGSGKTSLLNIVSLTDFDFEGDYFINGLNVKSLKNKDLALYRRKIAYVFQEYGLIESMSIYENILAGQYNLDIDKKEILNVLDILEIANLVDKKPREISGGQRQRVAIARALVGEKYIFVADELFSSLDKNLSEKIYNFIIDLYKNKIIILAAHNKYDFISDEFYLYELD